MPFGSSPAPPPDPESGLKADLQSFLKDIGKGASLRGELFAAEAKEAAALLGRQTTLLALGAILLALAYLLILAAAVQLLGATLSPDQSPSLCGWPGAALLLALPHLVLGFLFIRKGKNLSDTIQLFEYSKRELQNDQAWLNHTKKL